MAAVDPTDYPFNVDNEGWPENVYTPPYPHEYYYDNGQNSYETDPTTPHYTSELNNDHHRDHHHHHHHHHHHDQHHDHDHHPPNSNYTIPLPIRRHTPGSTDPILQQVSSRNLSPTPNVSVTVKRNLTQKDPYQAPTQNHSPTPNVSAAVKRNPPQKDPYQIPTQNHSPVSLDPDDRPIKPMKDTSVYQKPSSSKKPTQSKKPVSPSKSVQFSPRFESNSFQLPPPSSRTKMNDVTPRRPIRVEIIRKTPFGIPPQRNPSRQIVVEEYEVDDYPITYAKSVPEKIVSYQEVPGMTTRELENYEMSKPRRIVHDRPSPVKTIIYRT